MDLWQKAISLEKPTMLESRQIVQNLNLEMKRATEVKNYLNLLGINSSRTLIKIIDNPDNDELYNKVSMSLIT